MLVPHSNSHIPPILDRRRGIGKVVRIAIKTQKVQEDKEDMRKNKGLKVLVVITKRGGIIICRNPTLAKCGGEAQHLEKVRIWSPPGLPNVQSSTTRPKTPRIEMFLVSLERS
jgi:hypothetical protein